MDTVGEKSEKTTEQNARQSDTRRILQDFFHETSLHGVKFVVDETLSKFRRVLWATVILSVLVGLLLVLSVQMMHVFSRPILTRVLSQYSTNLTFPAVSICPEGVALDDGMLSDFDKHVVRNFDLGNRSFFQSLSREVYSRVNLIRSLKKRHPMQEKIITKCIFGKFYDCHEHVLAVWSKTSLCHTVSSVFPGKTSDPKPRLVSQSSGLPGGIYLEIEFPISKDASVPGVSIMLHDPDEKLSETTRFVRVAPGTVNYISVHLKRNKYLPSPYKAFGEEECQEIDDKFAHPFVTPAKYTYKSCQSGCLSEKYKAICGCRMDFDPEKEACDALRYIDCTQKLLKMAKNQSFVATQATCDCPLPCDDVIYETSLSSLPIRTAQENSSRGVVHVYVYFDRLRIESTEQIADYTVGDIVASVGGHLGLFLGASLVTVAEVLEMSMRCAWRWCLGKGARSPGAKRAQATAGEQKSVSSL